MNTSTKFSIVIYSFLFILLAGCNRFYKPVAVKKNTEVETLRKAIKNNKFLILRDSSAAYAMQHVRLNETNDTLYARLSEPGVNHTLYVTDAKRRFAYKPRKGQSIVLDEVHVFSDVNLPKDSVGNLKMPLTALHSIEIIEFDKKKTTTTRILGYALGVGAAIAIFMVATPSVSNPYN
jgi:hypothetical protein